MWCPEEHYTVVLTSDYLITKEQLKQLTEDEIQGIMIDLHGDGYINKLNDPDYVTIKEFMEEIKERRK